MAFNRSRVEALRVGLGNALVDLRGVRSDDPAAADAVRVLAVACKSIADVWLPQVQDILNSTSMTSCRRSGPGLPDISQASVYATSHPNSWETTTDPIVLLGPRLPAERTFDDVLADVRSGVLVPMTAPIDAHGRAGATYTSLTFATADLDLIATKDMTSNVLKVVDFFSDGLPIGWREEQSLTIYYLKDARITSGVHVLTAYDRDEGPDTMLDLTTVAVASGYMLVATDRTAAEVSRDIGTGDDTQSVSIISESSSSFAGVFYPDESPVFEPASREPRFESADLWTFTKSASPMTDQWGTWGL